MRILLAQANLEQKHRLRLGLRTCWCGLGLLIAEVCLARKFDATVLVDLNHLHGDGVAEFHDLVDVLHEAVCEFRNMAHAVGSWREFDKAAELLDRHDLAHIHGADADFRAESFDTR